MISPMDYNVFISYSSSDKMIADAICAHIEANKIKCWIAPRDIVPGTEYGEAIINGIEACRIFLLVFSSRANDSPQVRREVERAVSKGKNIISFRIEEVLPTKAMEFALSNTHWLDAINVPVEFQFSALMNSIQHLLQPRDTIPSSFSGYQTVKNEAAKGAPGNDSWIMRTTNGPGQRSGFVMAYDYKQGVIILHGGFGPATNADSRTFGVPPLGPMSPDLNDTWAWNGSSWKLLSNKSPGLVSHALAFCKKTEQNIISGGWTGSTRVNETLILTGETWIKAETGIAYYRDGFQNHAMAYDEKRQTIVLFGGMTIKFPAGQIALGDTWEWDGQSWSRIFVKGPEPRWGHKMVYDQSNGNILLFGGNDGKKYFDDTWIWNGNTAEWSKVTPGTIPGARCFHSLTCDTVRGRILMFGGLSASETPLRDLWEWNGTEWTLLMAEAPPKPRYNSGFVYDPRRNKSLLFGGFDGKEFFRDSWEFTY